MIPLNSISKKQTPSGLIL